MEKREQETKQTKNVAQKAKKIRSIVMLSLLCMLLLSAATYAWFTLSNTAKVSNLTMTVGDVTGLQVADYADTDVSEPAADWGSSTSPVKFNGTLLPATMKTDDTKIYKPHYSEEGSVDNVEDAESNTLTKNSNSTDTGYYVEYNFWIRALGKAGDKTTVKLDAGSGTNNGINSSSAKGTYSLSSEKGSGDILPSAAVRIGLFKDSNVKVFEPNSDFRKDANNKATDSRGDKEAKASDIKQNVDGTFSTEDTTVFSLDNNTPTKITLKIWLEGTDAQCGNEIAAKDIISQLKFVTA